MGLLGLFEKMERVETLIDKVTPKVSLETFLETVGDSIDQEIKSTQQEESVFFLGGKMHFFLSDDRRKIIMEAEMFYQNAAGGYQKAQRTGEYMVSMLNQEAVDDFVAQIVQQGEVVIEIREP